MHLRSQARALFPELSTRAANCLLNIGIRDRSELLAYVRANGLYSLLKTPNFGKTSFREVRAFVGDADGEVEITSAMAAAGASVLLDYQKGGSRLTLARAIFSAMMRAKPLAADPSLPSSPDAATPH